jgi:gluconate 5-dehydrogenase
MAPDRPAHPGALFDLSGQVAVVVGAGAGGLGEVAARTLSEAGSSVVLADLAQRHDDLLATRRGLSGASLIVRCDVTSEDDVAALVDSAIAAFGRIDILVNAAGLMLRKPSTATTSREWRRIIDVNLTGAWLLCRAVADHMLVHGYGRIVLFSSVYAERVGPMPESAYYTAKAGVANLTRAMAAEFGGTEVMVNCLAPGVFHPTPMTSALDQDPQRLSWLAERTLVKRLGAPDADLAGPLMLLCSKACSYMTGAVLYVDGGWSAC